MPERDIGLEDNRIGKFFPVFAIHSKGASKPFIYYS